MTRWEEDIEHVCDGCWALMLKAARPRCPGRDDVTLPNLSRLAAYHDAARDGAALIAAAPEMAELLIAIYAETEEGGCAFDCATLRDPDPCTTCRIRALLADFDRSIG
jgi:hypothetical protein